MEYYDPLRHPTSANLRRASELYLEPQLQRLGATASTWCEVGCGKTIAAPIATRLGHALGDLILVDLSPTMLSYSDTWTSRGARALAADAERLPIRADTLDLVISSLGDPYNTPAFWREVARTLKPAGICLFTSPSFAWARDFRGAGPDAQQACFYLADGRQVAVPSFVRSDDRQASVILEAGLVIEDVATITLGELAPMAISAQLLPGRGPAGPVVTGWRLRRP
jgi:SAM-dependent methyltransferase